jgi:hypothetical protein
MHSNDPNVAMVESVAARMGPLWENVVLVGGCAAGLLYTDPGAAPPRATRDVDLVVEVTALTAYYDMERALEARGFSRDLSPDAPICRWLSSELTVDLRIDLPSGTPMRLIAAPVFMATKLVAFADRGNQDFLASHDLEDVVNLLLARPGLPDEAKAMPDSLKVYLARECAALLRTPAFHDGLRGLITPDAGLDSMAEQVKAQMAALVRLDPTAAARHV